MTFFTSGTPTIDSSLTFDVCQFFETKCYPSIANYDVEIYYCDLNEDGVKGWQEKNGDEFLIHIDTNIVKDYQEHVKTLLHEFIHCCQDIRGVTNNEERECEAYKLEELYFNEFNRGEPLNCPYSVDNHLIYDSNQTLLFTH